MLAGTRQSATAECATRHQVDCQRCKDGVVVACGEGALRLLELQRAGKKRVNAAQFSANAANLLAANCE